MQDDIERWRSLGSQSLYTHPSHRVFLVPKKRKIRLPAAGSGVSFPYECRYAFADIASARSGAPVGGGRGITRRDGITAVLERSAYRAGLVVSKRKEPRILAKQAEEEAVQERRRIQKERCELEDVREGGDMYDKLAGLDPSRGNVNDPAYKSLSRKPPRSPYEPTPPPPQTIRPSTPTSAAKNSASNAPVRTIVPNMYFSLRKTEHHELSRQLAESLVGCTPASNPSGSPSNPKLRSHLAELTRRVHEDLESVPQTELLARLEIYSRAFDALIDNHFRMTAPLLGEIKRAYDEVVRTCCRDQSERVAYLAAKCQRLMAQNENRVLLKFERRRARELEVAVDLLRVENDKLKLELKRKLALYAGYLPPSLLHEKRKEDPMLVEIDNQIRLYNVGEDPITQYERRIEMLEEELIGEKRELENVRRRLEEEYCPKSMLDDQGRTLVVSENNVGALSSHNHELELEIAMKQTELANVEGELKKKDEQYQFLLSEYNKLSEAVALSFDKKVLTNPQQEDGGSNLQSQI
ncbi:hypothetical protein BJ742DRAFT_813688 [Cladochytrium replicatum]|nr:hypothetical protein BJ742DRAFT_813688 [Cladochytrium replicatum]